jgi:hypothetical protein
MDKKIVFVIAAIAGSIAWAIVSVALLGAGQLETANSLFGCVAGNE